MESKIIESLKSKGITDTSVKSYFNNLRRLNNGEEIKNLNFLKDVEGVLEKIKPFKSNTQRNYIIAVVTLLKEEPKFKKLYDEYFKIMMKFNKEKAVNNEKSETQKENWISQNEVEQVFTQLAQSVESFANNKKWTDSQFIQYLHYLVLSLYVLMPPRRNKDYQYCLVVNKLPEKMNKDFNYLDLKTFFFHFNNFKTAGTYSTQSFNIPPEAEQIIKTWLAHHPKKAELKRKAGMIFLLVDETGLPFENINSITRILNKIFKKRIGCSLLRNIYLTDKYGKNLDDLKMDAEQMGTSSSTIENQYVKLDEKVVSS